MLHMTGWFQDVDQGASAADIDAMPDETLFTSGDIIRVPTEIPFLVGVMGLTAATTFTSAQLQSPSLRTLANFDVLPFGRAATFENPQPLNWLGANPVRLIGDESLTFNTNTDHGSAIEIYAFVMLADAVPSPVNGEIFSVRATAGITLADGAWTNGALTFTQDLPFGTYDVVGLRIESTNAVAGRLVFPGGRWRPGVPAVNANSDIDFPFFRHGRMGTLGTFNSNSPPSVDIVGVTDTSETVILDLIKTG
tara:strand:+ start:633 stop:1385 length:753 start_codon:yes stop_codon:yes gene_type:complete